MDNDDFFGVLSVFTFVTLPNGRDKRVNLASIGCSYSERKEKFAEFKNVNASLAKASQLGAEFKFQEFVTTY